MTTSTEDEDTITAIVARFFAGFVSGPESAARLDALAALFHPRAVISRGGGPGAEPAVYDVNEFIEPRLALLAGDTLRDFREWPIDGHVEVFGDVAHWFGRYGKSGVRDGIEFRERGVKSLQFLRVEGEWRIIAAAWDDERDGGLLRRNGLGRLAW